MQFAGLIVVDLTTDFMCEYFSGKITVKLFH